MNLERVNELGVPRWRVREWEEAGFLHGMFGRELRLPEEKDVVLRHLSRIYPARKPVLKLLRQVHSAVLTTTSKAECHTATELEQSDGWIDLASWESPVDTADKALGILTADCVPVILRRPGGGAGVLHCGWRGLVKGILEKAIANLGPPAASNLEMLIGPAAKSCCYEVAPSFASEVVAVGGSLESPISLESRSGRWFCDLEQSLRRRAEAAGIAGEHIVSVSDCTICNPAYFSFRRENQQAGRQLSYVIAPCLSEIDQAHQ